MMQSPTNPIFVAIENNDLEGLKKIIDKDPSILQKRGDFEYPPAFYAIDIGNIEALKIIVNKDPGSLEEVYDNGHTLVFHAIIKHDLEAIKFLTKTHPKIFKQTDSVGQTPIFYSIIMDFPKALEEIIYVSPKALSEVDSNGHNPIYCAISSNNRDALKVLMKFKPEALLENDVLNQIIEKFPELLLEKNRFGDSVLFHHAMQVENLEALKKIIEAKPEVLEQRDNYGNFPIFNAMFDHKLNFLETIIKANPKVLEQENKEEITPIFYAIASKKLDALKTIITTNPKALEQENKAEEAPILYSLARYVDEPSDENKEILKFIFEKQFQRDLEDEEIKNLVEFVRNYNFLKLFYHQSGQGFHDKGFKSILSSCLPEEEKVDGDLSKKLLKIYQKITSQKTLVVSLDDANGKKTHLHIHEAELIAHAAYFIFHVNDENQLTKISYCEGNRALQERIISRRDATGREVRSDYIHGVTTFELKQPQAFNEKFAEEFIEKNSKKKTISQFYSQEFGSEKLASKQIFGIEFSAITHSIPTKMQSRGNCTSKSNHIASRFLLEQQEKSSLFTFDVDRGVQGGAGYKPYKDLRKKMVDKASEKLIESLGKFNGDVVDKIEIIRRIGSLIFKSVRKERNAKAGKSTTRFLSDPNMQKLYSDNIQKMELFGDAVLERLKSASQEDLKKHFISIFDTNINFNENDIKKINQLLPKIQVDETFLNHKFSLFDRTANFINFINDHGSDDQKKMCGPHINAIETRKKQLEQLKKRKEQLEQLKNKSTVQASKTDDGVVGASPSPQAPMASEVGASPSPQAPMASEVANPSSKKEGSLEK